VPKPIKSRSALLLTFLLVAAAFSEQATDRQKKAWADYRSRTEARIEGELDSKDSFLAGSFLPPEDRTPFEARLRNGQVPVVIRETRDARGREIEIPDGAVHHRLGAVLLRKASLDAVVRFAQNYDGHARVFLDVEESRLLSRRGDVFTIELLFRLARPERVRYLTEHVVAYRRLSPVRMVSFSLATRIQQLEGNTMTQSDASSQSGILKEMSSYWRFEQRPEGVVVECETISLSKPIPLLLRPIVSGYVQSIVTDSLRRTLLNLRDGFARQAVRPVS
jgi:hypothetical protein